MTDVASLRPIAAVLISGIAVPLILVSHSRPNLRDAWTIVAAVGKFGIVVSMIPGWLAGQVYVTDLGAFLPGIRFALRADGLGLLFGLVASILWIATSFFSIGYMRGLDEHAQTRYFAAFAASLSATIGVAFAANLVILFVFYELLSVATYPLVAHDETAAARAAGRKYLAYTFGGGVAVLAGAVMVFWLTGTTAFSAGGITGLLTADPVYTRLAFAVLAAGFGVKAALMPLHSWLPDAMIAPTPVSALLHAVAVVKSGVFGIARIVLDVFGPDLMGDLGIGLPLAAVAAFTLVTASVIALRQDNLKRRLAFSTVSQLSYIVLGLAVLTPVSIVGGLLHIPAHAFMKITLFFCAGAIHVETHTDYISNMGGIGKRMPVTMGAFAVAAAGMAGIPLLAGFVSKYFLLIGTISSGNLIFTAALLLSGILNIAYFWPVVYTAFFETRTVHDTKPVVMGPLGGNPNPEADVPKPDGGYTPRDERGNNDQNQGHSGPDYDSQTDWPRYSPTGGETTWFMLAPILFATVGSVVLGLAPDAAVFLRVIRLIVISVTGVTI